MRWNLFNRKRGKSKIHLRCVASSKKGVISEYLPWLLIGLAILAIVMITLFVLRGKGVSMIDRVKDLFRFR